MRCHHSIAVGAMLAAVLAAAPAVAQNAAIAVESRTLPAVENLINVRLEVGTGVEVVSTANTLVFDARAPIPANADGSPDCQVNPDIDKAATSFAFLPPGCLGAECTALRALVTSIENVAPIPNDSILYSCRLAADTALGSYRYGCEDPSAHDPIGADVAAACRGGEIVIDARAALLLGAGNYDSTYPPRRCSAQVVSRVALRRLSARFSFPPQVPLGLTEAGLPACRLDPEVPGITASFSCAGPDCAGRAAIELTADEATAIRDATVRCELVPDVTAPENAYPITTDAATATGVDGGAVPVDTTDADVAVFPPAPTPEPLERALLVGSVIGPPRSTVPLPIILRGGLPLTRVVFGVRRSPELDSGFAFPSDGTGHPVCRATPPLRIVDSGFTPEPCTGDAECGSIRVEIESDDPADALPDGTIATCDLAIDRLSEIDMTIVCQFVEAYSGSQTLSLDCGYGHLEVAFPTATPTATAPPATPTTTRRPDSGGGGGGCQLGDRTASAWPLVLALRLWWRRRRTQGLR